MDNLFIDLGFSQCNKHGESICGDAFKYQKSVDDDRVIAVLSDGLGSGVKANILASMTATMALKFAAESEAKIVHAAEIMMGALPICQVRKISYATFTIVNVGLNGQARIVEMGNPRFLLFRRGNEIVVPNQSVQSDKWRDRAMKVYKFNIEPIDRIIFFSDGISQVAMGTPEYPLGWRESGVSDYIRKVLSDHPGISSHELCEMTLREALRKAPARVNKDDMTCASLYFRYPRKMILFTGPPFDTKRDNQCAQLVANFDGEKVVSGGTSAEILSRELGRKLTMDLKNLSPEMPPMSIMDGVDLVTEGIFTLTKAAQYLEEYDGVRRDNPAGKMVEMFLRNDIIEILVGTRINEAHQDPKLPQDLEIRRSIVKRIVKCLEVKFLKKVNVQYV